MEKQVIANILITPDGTELVSRHRHDAVFYTDKNGKQYMTDGGVDYHHYIVHGDEKVKCITTESLFSEIREYFNWGSRGKDGKSPLVFKSLKDLDTDHIEAIIETQKQLPEWRVNIFKKELEWRST